MLFTSSQFSPVTAIEVNNKITNGLMVKLFPSCPAAQIRRTTASLICLGGLIHHPQHTY
jgi:hypothetical protein